MKIFRLLSKPDYDDIFRRFRDDLSGGRYLIVNLDFFNPVGCKGKSIEIPVSGKKIALIKGEECLHCNICEEKCHYSAIDNRGLCYCVDEHTCEGCGLCMSMCPADAIRMETRQGAIISLYMDETGVLIQVSELLSSFSPDDAVAAILEKSFEILETEELRPLIILPDNRAEINLPSNIEIR